MGSPIHFLPVVQNWDCHATGTCCHEYQVSLTKDEASRIDQQKWSETDLLGLRPYRFVGPPWKRRAILNHKPDGSCVFLDASGKCGIHTRFGYESKPLPCRLFPFILMPAGDHWRVGLRFACPSVAASRGRMLPDHRGDLKRFAEELSKREKLDLLESGQFPVSPPRVNGLLLDWKDTLQIVDVLMKFLSNKTDPIERRIRKCLYFSEQMRKTRLNHIRGPKLLELMEILAGITNQEVPVHPRDVPPPGWIGRILFRQAAAIFTRKDHGPNRGLASRGRVALLHAALRFTMGKGKVPRLHGKLPERSFDQLEKPMGPLPSEVESILERYFVIKIGSLQFAAFRQPFWSGLEAFLITFPVLLWVARFLDDKPTPESIHQALVIVDDHVGFNPVLASFRQQLGFSILSKTGQLPRLVAWYGR
ncbi:MAG: YkgJ family cysteine cluster protein [Gemmataceae bacterium]